MKIDTPLVEVAHLLPASAARYLGDCPELIQESVLQSVRGFVVHLEAQGVHLDPMAFEAVINGYVSATCSAHLEVFRQADQINTALQILDRAQFVLRQP